MLFTGFYTFTAEGAFVLNNLGYGFRLVPLYSLILTSLEALPAVGTGVFAPLSSRNTLQRLIVTEEGNLGICGNQLDEVQRAFSYAESAAGTLFPVYYDYLLLRVCEDGIHGAYLGAVFQSQAGVGASLMPAEELRCCFTGLYPGVLAYSL